MESKKIAHLCIHPISKKPLESIESETPSQTMRLAGLSLDDLIREMEVGSRSYSLTPDSLIESKKHKNVIISQNCTVWMQKPD
jgi:hypothetical protein